MFPGVLDMRKVGKRGHIVKAYNGHITACLTLRNSVMSGVVNDLKLYPSLVSRFFCYCHGKRPISVGLGMTSAMMNTSSIFFRVLQSLAMRLDL